MFGEDEPECNEIEGFVQNDDGTCHLLGPCPEGYHSEAENESGECYPDTEPCFPGQVRNQTDPNDRQCSEEQIVCEVKNYNKTACVRINDYPGGVCLTSPDQPRCNVPSGGCSGVFVQMSSVNFTSPKCVPDDRDQLEYEERKRQVNDPNRCARGYELINVECLESWN